MENMSSDTKSVPPVSEKPVQQSSVAQPVPSTPSTHAQKQRTAESPVAKPPKRLTFVIVILAVLLLALVGVGLVLLNNPSDIISPKPEHITITNITSRSFTVTWTTEKATNGRAVLLNMAKVLAMTAIDLLTGEELIGEIQEEFRATLAQRKSR